LSFTHFDKKGKEILQSNLICHGYNDGGNLDYLYVHDNNER